MDQVKEVITKSIAEEKFDFLEAEFSKGRSTMFSFSSQGNILETIKVYTSLVTQFPFEKHRIHEDAINIFELIKPKKSIESSVIFFNKIMLSKLGTSVLISKHLCFLLDNLTLDKLLGLLDEWHS